MTTTLSAALVFASMLLAPGPVGLATRPPDAGSVAPAERLPILFDAGVRDGRRLVDLDLEALRAHADAGPIVLDGLPLGDGRRCALRVERFRVTTPRSRFVVAVPRAGGAGTARAVERALAFDPERVVLLRGEVEGVPGSRVYLAASEWGICGRVELGEPGSGRERFVVSSTTPDGGVLDPGRLVVSRAAEFADASSGVPLCGVGAGRAGSAPAERGAPEGVTGAGTGDEPRRDIRPGLRAIELAIDTDYEYFELFGDLDAAAAYAVSLYGAVSDIYIREMNVRFDLTFVRLWDDPDDLYNAGDSPLGEFQSHWNAFMGHVPRDVAQLCTGRRNLSAGGVAYLSTVCSLGSAYSWAGYILGFHASLDGPSVYNRDVTVTAHELGHSCGTLHTHDYGVDDCDNAFAPPVRGDIMSYCGQTYSGGDANIDLRFHTRTRQAMSDYLRTQGCLIRDCNGNGADDAADIAAGASADANADGIPDECQDCNANGVLDPQDIAGGSSADLDRDGTPDECQPDCNANGVPDAKDIADGTSTDRHGNLVPDDCEEDCDADGISDYTEIMGDMALDIDRDARLDACRDCDADGVPDLVALDTAWDCWTTNHEDGEVAAFHALSGVRSREADDAGIGWGNDLVITPDERVLVSDGANHRIVEFARSGALVGDFVPPGGLAGELHEPAGMLLSGWGTLLVASRGRDSVVEYDLGSGALIRHAVPPGAGGLHQPFGLAWSPHGTLAVAGEPGCVLEFDPASGGLVRELVACGSGGLSQPRGVLFKPDGNLLVCSSANESVLEYAGGTGAFLGKWNRNGTASRLTLENPWCIRLGPDGTVYVSRADLHGVGGGEGGQDGKRPVQARRRAGLHLTDAKIYQFNAVTGNFMRAYVEGVDSGLAHCTGFDFMPGQRQDCNANQVPDACDIASGASRDANANGVPDECECAADFDGDGRVDSRDAIAFLNAFAAGDPRADLDGNGLLDTLDVLAFLNLFAAGCR